jgi:hypothetical protein
MCTTMRGRNATAPWQLHQRLHFVVFDIAVRASAQALATTISHFCAGLRFRTRFESARKKIGEVKK